MRLRFLTMRQPAPGHCRRVLEIRAAIGSAAVKKVFAMRNRLGDDDRLRDLFVFHGARTGRVTGDGPQPTNMPSGGPQVLRCGCGRHFGTHATACPWCGVPVAPGAKRHEWNPAAAEDALCVIATRDMHLVEQYFGDAMHAVSGCIRALYIAEDGCDLVCSDYSSIEAVGLAMISGEQWRMDVFRTHGQIYETSAARMFAIPFTDFARHEAQTGEKHPLRKKGKVAELAFGYQGWIGAARQFGMPGTDEEVKSDILAWRAASPSIEWLWGGQTRGKADGIRANAGLTQGRVDRWSELPEFFGAEGMAVQAILSPGHRFEVLRLDGSKTGVSYLSQDNALYCRLPSGRDITYHRPRLRPSTRGGLAISYEGWNTNPKNGPKGWIAMDTWGGRLVENIVQGTCRDILRFAILHLRRAGYSCVLHIYDEIVAEVPKGRGNVADFEQTMATSPAWAFDWPIKVAGGWHGGRYRKS